MLQIENCMTVQGPTGSCKSNMEATKKDLVDQTIYYDYPFQKGIVCVFYVKLAECPRV